MFDIGFSELIVIGIVTLVVVGPERMPRVARTAGLLLGRVQRIRHDRDHSYVVRVLAMQYEAKARAVHEGLRARKRRLAAG